MQIYTDDHSEGSHTSVKDVEELLYVKVLLKDRRIKPTTSRVTLNHLLGLEIAEDHRAWFIMEHSI